MQYKRSQTGYTMIELLVAATIIAILTVVGIVSFRSTNLRAHDGKRKGDLEQVRASLELYRSDTTASSGLYPITASFTSMTSTLRTNSYISDPLPQDPKNTGSYVYSYSSTAGTSYCTCALLEVTGVGNSSNTACNGVTGNYYCLTNP
jgi:prepilin-type N-terminal cleavage/methylation domain-containing protein